MLSRAGACLCSSALLISSSVFTPDPRFFLPQNIFSGLGDKASDAEGTAKDAQGDLRGAVSDAAGSA